MKLPKNINPAHCISKDETRPVLNGIAVQGRLAVATDARMLVAAIVSRDKDNSYRDAIIPKKAIMAAAKLAGKTNRETLFIEEDGRSTIVASDDETSSFRDLHGKFPQWIKNVPKGTPRRVLHLNVNLLAQVAKALGTDSVSIHTMGDSVEQTGPLVITAEDTPEAFGILMPKLSRGAHAMKSFESNKALHVVRLLQASRP